MAVMSYHLGWCGDDPVVIEVEDAAGRRGEEDLETSLTSATESTDIRC